MTNFPKGRIPQSAALVYCEGAFGTLNGKTAHGLVRFTERYRVLGVVDSTQAGKDAGQVLDGKPAGIPIYAGISASLEDLRAKGAAPTHFVIGLAPDGGRLPAHGRDAVKEALRAGLDVDNGLHDYLLSDPDIAALAASLGRTIRDVRKAPPADKAHFFTAKIEEVTSLKVAVLGTDSAVGKRTTAWSLVHGMRSEGHSAELIGTGQTAWLQGARYSIQLDTLVNDFLTGEIEHVVWSAWHEQRPDVLVIEGQGGLLNPAYPGGYEIIAASRPDVIVLQHVPARKTYDAFPMYPIHPLKRQIEALEIISGKPVVAITINHEDMTPAAVRRECAKLSKEYGLPVCDVLLDGPGAVIAALKKHLHQRMPAAANS